MDEEIGRKKFLCRVVEGRHLHGHLKCPSPFASFFGLMELDIIGLHLPNSKTWLGRFDSTSETILEIESLLEYFDVKPWYLFALEYIGGTEFQVEIFNDFAVEVNYSGCVKRGLRPPGHLKGASDGVFDISEIEKDKLHASFSYNSCSSSEGDQEIVITDQHLQGAEFTQVLSKDEVEYMGINADDKWMEMGLKKFTWRMQLHWKDGEVWFDKGWTKFAEDCKLVVGDICMLRNTTHGQRFEVAIYEKHRISPIEGNVGAIEGKGVRKWFKIITWISAHTGEVEVPYVFAKVYGSGIKDSATLVLPDGFTRSCYFSGTAKLIYGFKDLMMKYGVRENFTMFFNYIGRSTFYVTIYNEEGMEIFNDLPEKLSLFTAKNKIEPEVYTLSDNDDNDDSLAMEGEPSSSMPNIFRKTAEKRIVREEDSYNFSITLLKSHVDQNGHGVYLPRYLVGLYRKWNRGTIVNLVMESTEFQMQVLRRKKTCRLGVGWNDFTLKNNLHVGQRLTFTFMGNTTFHVSKAA